MLLGVVRSCMRHVARRVRPNQPTIIRVSLQADDPSDHRPRYTRPYLINAFVDYPEGELEVDFLKLLDSPEHDLHMQYDLSQRIPSREISESVKSRVERALHNLKGRSCSLTVVCPDIPREAFSIGGIHLTFDREGIRSGPVYMFIQSHT